jgi:hypothetical protein
MSFSIMTVNRLTPGAENQQLTIQCLASGLKNQYCSITSTGVVYIPDGFDLTSYLSNLYEA